MKKRKETQNSKTPALLCSRQHFPPLSTGPQAPGTTPLPHIPFLPGRGQASATAVSLMPVLSALC